MHSKNILHQAVMQAWNAVVITDADLAAGCRVIFVNPAFCEMTGYSQAELLGQSLNRLQGPETDPAVIADMRTAMKDGTYFEGMTRNYRKDGTSYLVRWNLSPVRSADGVITQFVSVQQDITALVMSEERNRLLAAALNSSSDPIHITDAQSRIVFANSAFLQLTEMTLPKLLGKRPDQIRLAEDYEGNSNIKLYRNASGQGVTESGHRRRGDEVLFFMESRSPILNKKGEASHYVTVGKDISRRIKLERSLRISASRDKLTDLYNRDFGQAYLENAHDKAVLGNEQLSVIMCDIDNFKAINDTFGHSTGDKVIRLVADTLKKAVRDEDAVIRWGGEEFLIILNECPLDPASRLAERIRRNVEASALSDIPGVSLSLGVAALSPDETIGHLIDRADVALYESKRNGRNRLSVSRVAA